MSRRECLGVESRSTLTCTPYPSRFYGGNCGIVVVSYFFWSGDACIYMQMCMHLGIPVYTCLNPHCFHNLLLVPNLKRTRVGLFPLLLRLGGSLERNPAPVETDALRDNLQSSAHKHKTESEPQKVRLNICKPQGRTQDSCSAN